MRDTEKISIQAKVSVRRRGTSESSDPDKGIRRKVGNVEGAINWSFFNEPHELPPKDKMDDKVSSVWRRCTRNYSMIAPSMENNENFAANVEALITRGLGDAAPLEGYLEGSYENQNVKMTLCPPPGIMVDSNDFYDNCTNRRGSILTIRQSVAKARESTEVTQSPWEPSSTSAKMTLHSIETDLSMETENSLLNRIKESEKSPITPEDRREIGRLVVSDILKTNVVAAVWEDFLTANERNGDVTEDDVKEFLKQRGSGIRFEEALRLFTQIHPPAINDAALERRVQDVCCRRRGIVRMEELEHVFTRLENYQQFKERFKKRTLDREFLQEFLNRSLIEQMEREEEMERHGLNAFSLPTNAKEKAKTSVRSSAMGAALSIDYDAMAKYSLEFEDKPVDQYEEEQSGAPVTIFVEECVA